MAAFVPAERLILATLDRQSDVILLTWMNSDVLFSQLQITNGDPYAVILPFPPLGDTGKHIRPSQCDWVTEHTKSQTSLRIGGVLDLPKVREIIKIVEIDKVTEARRIIQVVEVPAIMETFESAKLLEFVKSLKSLKSRNQRKN
jgi:hypothetical protein